MKMEAKGSFETSVFILPEYMASYLTRQLSSKSSSRNVKISYVNLGLSYILIVFMRTDFKSSSKHARFEVITEDAIPN